MAEIVGPLILIVLVALCVVTGWGMHALRVFKPDAVVGPSRWEGVPLLTLVAITCAGFFALMMCTSLSIVLITGSATEATTEAATQATKRPMDATLAAAVAVGSLLTAGALVGLRSLAKTKLPAMSLGRQVKVGLVSLALIAPWVYLTGSVTMWILGHLGVKIPSEHELITLLKSEPSLLVRSVVMLSAVVAAPVMEELLFRGCLQTTLSAGFSRKIDAPTARFYAIMATSGLFALMHPAFSWSSIFVLSLALGYLYERTGRLWPCIVAHAGFNSISLSLALAGLA